MVGYPKTGDHINALELYAIFVTFEWRASEALPLGCRVVHCTDSQVCQSVLTKGRSSSRRLSRILRRLNALLLACAVVPVFLYIRSEDNPADEPSRQQWASV